MTLSNTRHYVYNKEDREIEENITHFISVGYLLNRNQSDN